MPIMGWPELNRNVQSNEKGAGFRAFFVYIGLKYAGSCGQNETTDWSENFVSRTSKKHSLS